MAEVSSVVPKDTTTSDFNSLVARAKRAFRLKQYEEAVDLYGQALETFAGECNPQSVDLYYLYGLSLLENAIASNSVLGKTEEQPAEEEEEPAEKGGNAPDKARFVFGADGGDDEPVDLFAQAEAMLKAQEEQTASGGQEEAENGGNNEEDDEPEDDFNAAWEILDLARKTYESMEGEVNRLKLAHTYMALGDVSLETEKFEQAILDTTSALEIRSQYLPNSSREIADCHFRLSMAYDMTVGQLEKQVEHVEKALSSVKAREEELEAALPSAPDAKPTETTTADSKGKGKASTATEADDPLNWLPKDDAIATMTKTQIEAELRDIKAVREDLEAKLEDVKTAPTDGSAGGTTMDRVKSELDRELGLLGAGSVAPDAQVNDLSGLVKKKKKPAPAAPADAPVAATTNAEPSSLGKRKAEDEPTPEGTTEKKARLE